MSSSSSQSQSDAHAGNIADGPGSAVFIVAGVVVVVVVVVVGWIVFKIFWSKGK